MLLSQFDSATFLGLFRVLELSSERFKLVLVGAGETLKFCLVLARCLLHVFLMLLASEGQLILILSFDVVEGFLEISLFRI